MADPDVLKRLEEIEDRNRGECDPVCPTMDVRYLLRLTRAMLESQGELIRTVGSARAKSRDRQFCARCDAVLSRAERVRRGDL